MDTPGRGASLLPPQDEVLIVRSLFYSIRSPRSFWSFSYSVF